MNEATEQSSAVSGELLDQMPPAQLPTVAGQQVNPYLSMVETMVARGGDLSNLGTMLELQIKWEANEARKAYVAAMAAFKAEPMEILKRKAVGYNTKEGDFVGYKHAELSDVTDAVVPAMGKHGLSHRWDVQQAPNLVTVICQITHALGHTESVTMSAAPDDSGKKNKIQQVASTVSYLQRYTLLAATGMAAKGMDDDGRGSEGAGTNGTEGQQDEEYEAAMQSWRDGIDGCVDQLGLKSLKGEMAAKFGSQQSIPKELIRHYNARWAAVTPPKAAQS